MAVTPRPIPWTVETQGGEMISERVKKTRAAVTAKEAATASPPSLGIGCVWIFLSPGRSTALTMCASRMTSGVKRRAAAAATPKAMANCSIIGAPLAVDRDTLQICRVSFGPPGPQRRTRE
jgi:hypothetical protein